MWRIGRNDDHAARLQLLHLIDGDITTDALIENAGNYGNDPLIGMSMRRHFASGCIFRHHDVQTICWIATDQHTLDVWELGRLPFKLVRFEERCLRQLG